MITAHQQTVSKVLGDGYVHEIPPYQRPYAWTDTESSQLLEDISDAATTSDTEPYFLGSIVLIRPPEDLVGQVVDGQQRLTTLTILAAVLRDVAEDPQERGALANAVYIEPNPFMNQVEAVRVLAHREDRDFFRAAIQTPGSTSETAPPLEPKNEAQGLMWANAQALRKSVLDMSLLDRQRLVTFLLNQCVLVVVSTESRTAALRIFRVLNDRGLSLTNADVIKADLLDKFPDELEQSRQAALWREFETDVGRDDLEVLLDSLRFIRERTKSRKALSDSYALRFKDATPADVREFFEGELTPAKKWFSLITDADYFESSETLGAETSEALAGLRLVPNKDWIPAALAATMQLGTTSELAQTLTKLEGLAWSMQLCRKYDTQRMNRYGAIITALMNNKERLDEAFALSNDENMEAWVALNGPVYQRFPVRVVRAILERLDRLLAEQPVSWSGLRTVEHILPQTPAPSHWENFSEADRERVTDTLGNLVLLTSRKNASASNRPFVQKRDVYFGLGKATNKKRATYASVQELAHLSDWDMDSYSERHSRHVGTLANYWGIRSGSLGELV